MDSSPQISIVIPVFNAASCLRELILEIRKAMITGNKSFEIICVDDGSKDDSWKIIRELQADIKELRGFKLRRNFGQHKATLCGIQNSKGDFVITMDDDYEHLPENFGELIQVSINSGADVVYGVPKKMRKSFLRGLCSSFFKWISKVENVDAGKGSSFRLIRKPIVDELKTHASHLIFLDEILLWHTDNIKTATLEFGKSRKKSGYNYRKLFSLSENVFMLSTTMPLKLMKFVGFTMAAFSFLFGIYHIIHKLFFPTEKGFTSIILSIVFSAGMILVCLGIIGEYLGNILMMQSNKPAYSIEKEI
jgi:polyisoprenyl-phosphate glycosyltransferase